MKYLGKHKVKHVEDWNIKVDAKVYIEDDGELRAYYKYNKMSWSCNIPMEEAIKSGLIECGKTKI
ncbi:TPA: hypothetical protein ACGZ9C_003138 [Elizabethkingia anophelis]